MNGHYVEKSSRTSTFRCWSFCISELKCGEQCRSRWWPELYTTVFFFPQLYMEISITIFRINENSTTICGNLKIILLKSSQNNQKSHTNCTYKRKIASGGACGGLKESIRTKDESGNWMGQNFHNYWNPWKNTAGSNRWIPGEMISNATST